MRQQLIKEILDHLSKTYCEGSGQYIQVKKMLNKKAVSNQDIHSLWSLVMTSTTKNKEG
tara:strand:- start:288 stop:464 length:177 start_codon:yes stop_codon:yes gene_type:complete